MKVFWSHLFPYTKTFLILEDLQRRRAQMKNLIAVNGPNLAHGDSVVKESMDNYWASRGGK